MPIPQGRPSRKIPKSFNRPSVDLDRTPREWRKVLASQLTVGDTVASAGKIQALIKFGNLVAATNIVDARHEWLLSEEVFAFVRRRRQ